MKLLFGSGNLNSGFVIMGYLKGGNVRLGLGVNTMLCSSLARKCSSSNAGGVLSILPEDVVTVFPAEVSTEFLSKVFDKVHLERFVSCTFEIDGSGAESPCMSIKFSSVYLISV